MVVLIMEGRPRRLIREGGGGGGGSKVRHLVAMVADGVAGCVNSQCLSTSRSTHSCHAS